MKKEDKKGTKNKNKDEKKFNFLGDWTALNPSPEIVQDDNEKKFNFLGDWTALNPSPEIVQDDKAEQKKK